MKSKAKKAVLPFLVLGAVGLVDLITPRTLNLQSSILDRKTTTTINRPRIPVARTPTSTPPLPVSAPTQLTPDAATQARVQATFSRLPLSFEVNRGQTDSQVKFLSRGKGYTLFLTSMEAVMVLRKAEGGGMKDEREKLRSRSFAKHNLKSKIQNPKSAVLRMKLQGANREAEVAGLDELPGKSNYFIGNDPTKWRTNVLHYAKVKYEEVYPGIDLVYYGNQSQLEYDFVVAPGADPSAIQLAFEGADRIEMDASGHLVMHTPTGHVQLRKPLIYQEVDGVRQEISGSYVLNPKSKIENPKLETVGFQVASYNPTKPLIIDPVLVYSTYLGGSRSDGGRSITVDSSGNAYVAGSTFSADFPTTEGAFQPACGEGCPVTFVTKVNPEGSALIYSTYLGGSSGDDEVATAIAVDASGNAYVVGFTDSTDFPTVNGFQPACAVDEFGNCEDVFVAKLNPAGSELVYSTYLGGSNLDFGSGIAVDGAGSAYVTGVTFSTDFPTANAFQEACSLDEDELCSGDAFVAKLNSEGSALIYSTYLGGSSIENLIDFFFFPVFQGSIAVDSFGNAYVTGFTFSTDFPTVNPLQPACSLGEDEDCSGDAFVAKLNSEGSALIYSTYLGGSSGDAGSSIAVHSSGNAYVTGFTFSTDFPTVNPFQAVCSLNEEEDCSGDAFVAKLNSEGSALIYSTYLGGSGFEDGRGIAVDSSGNAYVTGSTDSIDFPTANPLQAACGGAEFDVCFDAFVAKLNADGSALVYSTYLGGEDLDEGRGIAVDSSGNAYVTGSSPGFPTTPGAFQTTSGGDEDAFVAKISPLSIPPLKITTARLPTGQAKKKYSAVLAATGGTKPYTWSLVSGRLPPGLTLSATGKITGTPTRAGSFSFAVKVRDSLGGTAQKSLKILITLVIGR